MWRAGRSYWLVAWLLAGTIGTTNAQCIDYERYLHWMGTLDLPYVATDLAVSGSYAFATLGVSGMQVIEIVDPLAPSFLGHLDTASAAVRVAVAGDRACVLTADGDLLVVDVADLFEPTVTGNVDAPSDGILAGSSTRACVAVADSLHIFGIDVGGVPQLAGIAVMPGPVSGVALSGTHALVTTGMSVAGLAHFVVVDLTVSEDPAIVVDHTFGPEAMASGITVADDRAAYWVSTHGGGVVSFELLDISDPAHPVDVGSMPFGSGTTYGGVALSGLHAFVWFAGADSGGPSLYGVDFNRRFDGEIVGSLSGLVGSDRGVTNGTHAFFLAGGEVQVFSSKRPHSPAIVGSDPTPGLPRIIAVGNYIYGTGDGEGLRIYDVSDPSNPEIVGPGSDILGGLDIAATEERVYVAQDDRLRMFDIADPVNPQPIGHVGLPGNVTTVAANDGVVFAGSGIGLHVIVGSQRVGFVPTSSGIVDVDGVGDLAIVTANDLMVVDVSSPHAPEVVGSIEVRGCVAASGDHAYVAEEGFLKVVDLSAPAFPEVVETAQVVAGHDVIARGVHVYVAGPASGLQVIDVSNPSNPRLVGNAYGNNLDRGTTTTVSVAAAGDFVFLSDLEHGLQVFPAQCQAVGITDATSVGLSLRIYPNPFNPATTVSFDLPKAGVTRLEVYDLRGRMIRMLRLEYLDAGFHTANWNGRDGGGRCVPSGSYFCRLTAPGTTLTSKMLLLK